jgi:hypothetical protein
MMTGKMSCGAAHQSALDAPFGLGRCRYGDECYRNQGASKSLVHLFAPGNRSRKWVEAVVEHSKRRKSSIPFD